MTAGEMLTLTNRLKGILSSGPKELKNSRLELLLMDIEDAYTNDPFATRMYTTVYEFSIN